MIRLLTDYFAWLQKGNPTGVVDPLPEIDDQNRTSLPGVFIAGDLTGIPLLTLAAQSGSRIADQLIDATGFKAQVQTRATDITPIIVVGAGPAGIAAAITLKKRGIDYLVLESTRTLNTIENFPMGKPIHVDSDQKLDDLPLTFNDGKKESLLAELKEQIDSMRLNIKQDEMVKRIFRENDALVVETPSAAYKARRVILAIGKSGNSRALKVPGENLDKVFNQLYDPQDFRNKKVLVVGGGDSALEASIAIANCGGSVTHSYRQEAFARPKERNIEEFERLTKEGRIKPEFQSEVIEIASDKVIIKTPQGQKSIENDAVLTLIGKELPLEFFKRSGIKIEGERNLLWYVQYACLLSFFFMLYFGKKGNAYDVFSGITSVSGKFWAFLTAPWQLAMQKGLITETSGYFAQITASLSAPFHFSQQLGLSGYQAWLNPLCFLIGWLGAIAFMASGVVLLVLMLRETKTLLSSVWHRVKYAFLAACSLVFLYTYVSSSFSTLAGWVNDPTQNYALLYCVVMLFFGIHRVYTRKTKYVAAQVFVLVFIQIFFLYLLPFGKIGDNHIFDLLIGKHFASDSWVMTQVFPIGRWTSFWFILFWPLSIDGFGATTFWSIFPFFQHAFLFYIIYHWGKGAYCGWICSCGGMAETLGDEYRTLAPHGPKAKKLENIGQGVLLFAVIATILRLLHKKALISGALTGVSAAVTGSYLLVVDIIFAGVMGLGVYFFLSGRIWCRFACPLAAVMHIMTRFSRYRIMSEKKKCISCGLCTKVCHMGIDVMGFANKGIPMNDVECVRCSACIHTCPMQVLAFGKLPTTDLDNNSRLEMPDYGKKDWRAGLS